MKERMWKWNTQPKSWTLKWPRKQTVKTVHDKATPFIAIVHYGWVPWGTLMELLATSLNIQAVFTFRSSHQNREEGNCDVSIPIPNTSASCDRFFNTDLASVSAHWVNVLISNCKHNHLFCLTQRIFIDSPYAMNLRYYSVSALSALR